jgi:hypothetical protein
MAFSNDGSYAARCDALERHWQIEEKEHDAMERMALLYQSMADEFSKHGKTRRWHSLMRRSEYVRTWWCYSNDDDDQATSEIPARLPF